MDFYSARLLFIVLVDDGRPRKKNLHDESVVLFRARDFKQAKRKALKIGRTMETKYKNDKGQGVRWALVSILDLSWVGRKVDGVEVASYLYRHRSMDAIPFDKVFHPEKVNAYLESLTDGA